MADFYFDVDTHPMAQEIDSVSGNVRRVSAAVVAMQTAVVAAEQEGAELVCDNVNKGFFTLMQSQITQKIAQLSSTVEAKLFELAEYSKALVGIRTRMQGDYNMISARYGKLFNTLNTNLRARVSELDKPAFSLVEKDAKLLDSRKKVNAALFALNQLESVLSAQMLVSSKSKDDARRSIHAMKSYLANTIIQDRKSQESMYPKRIECNEEICIPVSIVESAGSAGVPSMKYYVPKSGNQRIDQKIENSVREQSVDSLLHGNWGEIDGRVMDRITAEFSSMLEGCSCDERVKKEIARMFSAAGNVQQLNPVSHELQ